MWGTYVLDARRGTLLKQLPNLYADDMVVDEPAGQVLAITALLQRGRGTVSFLDARDGHLLHTVIVGRNPTGLAVDSALHHAFVTNAEDDSVSMLDTRTGTLLGTIPVGFSPQGVAVDPASSHVFVAENGSNSVSMLDGRSGRVLRHIVLGHSPRSVAIDGHTGRAVVDDDGSMSIFDTRSGALLRTLTGLGASTIAGDERAGHVVVAGYDHALLLDARSGAVRLSVTLDGSLPQSAAARSIAIDGQAGRTYIIRILALASGIVDVVDERTGRLQRLPAGRNPCAIGADSAAHRVFVLDGGGPVPAADPWWWLPSGLRRLPLPYA